MQNKEFYVNFLANELDYMVKAIKTARKDDDIKRYFETMRLYLNTLKSYFSNSKTDEVESDLLDLD